MYIYTLKIIWLRHNDSVQQIRLLALYTLTQKVAGFPGNIQWDIVFFPADLEMHEIFSEENERQFDVFTSKHLLELCKFQEKIVLKK